MKTILLALTGVVLSASVAIAAPQDYCVTLDDVAQAKMVELRDAYNAEHQTSYTAVQIVRIAVRQMMKSVLVSGVEATERDDMSTKVLAERDAINAALPMP